MVQQGTQLMIIRKRLRAQNKVLFGMFLTATQLANFGGRIVDYIICAETETDWHFPVTYIYFYNSATISFPIS
jgi:hypothetical protein